MVAKVIEDMGNGKVLTMTKPQFDNNSGAKITDTKTGQSVNIVNTGGSNTTPMEKAEKLDKAINQVVNTGVQSGTINTSITDNQGNFVVQKKGDPALPQTVNPQNPANPSNIDPDLKNAGLTIDPKTGKCVQGTFGCPYDFTWSDEDQSCGRSVSGYYCHGGKYYVINLPATHKAANNYFETVSTKLNSYSTEELYSLLNLQSDESINDKLETLLNDLNIYDSHVRSRLLSELQSRLAESDYALSQYNLAVQKYSDAKQACEAGGVNKYVGDSCMSPGQIESLIGKCSLENRIADLSTGTCGDLLPTLPATPTTTCKTGFNANKTAWITCGGPNGNTPSYTFCSSGTFTPDGKCETITGTSVTYTPSNPGNSSKSSWNGEMVYVNQKSYGNVKVRGGEGNSTWATSGCGVMAGAMVFSLRTGEADPYAYSTLLDQHGGVTSAGTGWFEQHKVILEENGFTVTPVYGSVAEKRKQIAEYAKEGIPVWINAYIDNGSGAWIGHHTLAVGVDESTGNIILNDPYYGENYSMPIERFDIDCSNVKRIYNQNKCPNGTESWIMNAIIP